MAQQIYSAPSITRSSAIDNPTESDFELLTITSSISSSTITPSYVKIISDNITTNQLSQKIFPLKNDDYQYSTTTGVYSINVLFDVRANQQYTFKAKVVYSDGNYSAYSSMYSFTSSPTTPVILSAFGDSETSIFLTVVPQFEVTSYTAVLSYLDYSNFKQMDIVENLTTTDSTKQFIEITNLLQNVEYTFSIFAINSNGQSYLSNSMISTTKPQPGPVLALTASFDNNANVTLNWTLPLNSVHLSIDSYHIKDEFDNLIENIPGGLVTSHTFSRPYALNESYSFKMISVHMSNNIAYESVPSLIARVSIPECEEVKNLHITSIDPTSLLITINWDYPSQLIILTTKYNCMLEGKLVRQTGACGFDFQGEPNKSYSFTIVPIHHDYVTGLDTLSSQVSVINAQIPLTGCPRTLNATFNSAGDIILTWLAPLNNNVITTTSYNIYDKNTNNLLGSTTDLTYTLSNQVPGLSYGFYVKSVHGSVEGSSSMMINISIPSPSAPLNLVGVINPIGEPTISLSWALPSNNSTISTDSFKVYQDNVLVYSGAQLSFVTGVLIAGVQNTFVVKPVHSSVEFNNFATLSITPFQNASAPTNVIATPKNNSIILSWSNPSNIGGGTPTKYILLYGSTSLDIPISPGSYSQTISGLTNKSTYNFTLYMVTNTNVNGSIASVASTPTGLPIVNSISLSNGVLSASIDNNGSNLVQNFVIISFDGNNTPSYQTYITPSDINGIVTITQSLGSSILKANLIVSNVAGLTIASTN
jgi:hypothetical protein